MRRDPAPEASPAPAHLPTQQRPAHAARGAPTILAAGERLAQSLLSHQWASPEVQRILFAARQRFGHALCTCRPQPLKLQIRVRADKCHLAVWPGEHRAHDKACVFFQPQPTSAPASGRERAPPAAPLRARRAPRIGTQPRSHAAGRTAFWIGAPAGAPRDAALVSVQSLAQRL